VSSLLDRIYAKSPVFVQNVMATGYGMKQRMLRHRGEYQTFYEQLERQQWLSRDELQRIQDAAVRRTIEYAAREVPYYRELWAQHGIRPEHVQTAADLKILPFTDKAVMQAHGERLRPERAVPAIPQTTGGTTGRPVPYWVTPSAIQFNYATYEARFRRWAGVAFGDRMVSINGKPIVPMTQAGPPYWRHNLAFNQLYVSAYHLSDTTLPFIVERMAAFKPRVIVAYVSAVHRIARFMLEHGHVAAIRPHAILVSSETLFDWQRADLENAFGCKVFNGYSLGEPVCFVSECERGGMHVSPEFGVVELVEEAGGQEIVATGLINDAMPLIRYKTGDYASFDDRACACGRALPTLGPITGRVDEMVLTPEGTSVGPASLSLAFQSVPNLLESQIVQDSAQAIALKCVVTPAFTPANEAFMLQELRKRLGLTLRIDVEYVPSIGKTVSGKQRLVVSSLKRRAS
jgi:phenylacetate-CoA ligase